MLVTRLGPLSPSTYDSRPAAAAESIPSTNDPPALLFPPCCCCILDTMKVGHSLVVVNPTYTPTADPTSPARSRPDRTSASSPTSSSIRWCGSMERTSAGPMLKAALSNSSASCK